MYETDKINDLNGAGEPGTANRPDESKPDGDHRSIRPQGRALKWLDNFWYHHKWHTLIALFVVAVVVVLIVQTVQQPGDDVLVCYAGTYGFSPEELEEVRTVLDAKLPQDFNGDGKKHVGFVRYQVYSAEELELDVKENNGHGTVNTAFNASQKTAFDQFVMTGECSVYLCSPYLYEQLLSRGVVRPLCEVLDAVPENSYSDYAVRLAETRWYTDNVLLRRLPPDTLIVMTIPYAWGASASQDQYANSAAMFREMIEAPEATIAD